MMFRPRALGLALVGALLLACSPAWAQVDPNDPLGLGVQRGIQELNNSGQVGTVTLFHRGQKTFVDVTMHGVPPGKGERVGIYRIASCSFPVGATPGYALEDLHNARSRTLVHASVDKLLSGNYSVVVRSQLKPDHLFACGQLYG
jgi:hypothetical protein